jgi:hypothetical protein
VVELGHLHVDRALEPLGRGHAVGAVRFQELAEALARGGQLAAGGVDRREVVAGAGEQVAALRGLGVGEQLQHARGRDARIGERDAIAQSGGGVGIRRFVDEHGERRDADDDRDRQAQMRQPAQERCRGVDHEVGFFAT